MARHVDLLVIVNRGALTAKYGGAGAGTIRAALDRFGAAARARQTSVRVIAIDRTATMRSLGGSVVTSPTDHAATKAAIDAACTATTPHYVLLLGAPDLIAHQPLRNPTNDDDPGVPSDLPYACEHAASSEPAAFVGPTRVVGRLPDLVGEVDPGYLVGLLDTAATWRPRPAADYAKVFALSTDTWKVSTRLSVERLAGSAVPVHLSPPDGPNWTKAQLRARTHFVNCHGDDTDPSWYGERAGAANLPVAHTAARLSGRVAAGTVVAAECCYGAQHYPPSLAPAGQAGLAATYLRQGAVGVVGSSTLSYGPTDDMGAADLITRFFLQAVADGASLGRALLAARQRFVQELGELDPVDLKTLIQFDLLGDPSLHPVKVAPPKHARKGSGAARAARRATMAGVGNALAMVTSRASSAPARVGRSRAGAVAAEAGVAVAPEAVVTTFRSTAQVPTRARFHVIADGAELTVVREEPGTAPTSRTVVRK